MSLLLLLRSPAAAVNLSASGGTSTASGGADTITWALSSSSGTGTGGGGSVIATIQGALIAADGAATGSGGTDTVRFTLAAASGTASAGGGTVSLPGLLGARGKFVLTNALVKLNGQDVSRYCHTIQVQLDRDEIDVTPLGAQYREFMPGPTTGTFTVGMMHDPVVHTPAYWNNLAGTATIEVAPRNFPAAPDNPTWTATVRAVRRTMLQGQAGERAEAGLELRSTTEVLQLNS